VTDRDQRNTIARRLHSCERELEAAQLALRTRQSPEDLERHRLAHEELAAVTSAARDAGVIHDPLVRTCDAERILGLSSEQIDLLVRDGRLPVELAGHQRRFRLSDVRRLASRSRR